MTSSESQPRTRAGLDVMRKIDGNTVGPDDEEIYLDDILAVESEAWEQGRADFRRAVNKAAAAFQENGEAEVAQDSRPLDVEDVILEFGQWLADDSTRMMRLGDAIEEDQPDAFRAIAAEFAGEEPHD